DLGTVAEKLEQGSYNSFEAFQADVRLTFDNAMKYNTPDTTVHHVAKSFLKRLGWPEEVPGPVAKAAAKVGTENDGVSGPVAKQKPTSAQQHNPCDLSLPSPANLEDPARLRIDNDDVSKSSKSVAKAAATKSVLASAAQQKPNPTSAQQHDSCDLSLPSPASLEDPARLRIDNDDVSKSSKSVAKAAATKSKVLVSAAQDNLSRKIKVISRAGVTFYIVPLDIKSIVVESEGKIL
ncbi:hypothetical protein THAOC_11176, partial [Thalassiosira oceanica]